MLQTLLVMHTYQNDRWYPVRGWGGHLLVTDRDRWTNEDGTVTTRREDVPLPDRYAWQGEWEVAVDAGVTTDADGWSYAIDFPRTFRKSSSIGSVVRRRKWERLAVLHAPSPGLEELVEE